MQVELTAVSAGLQEGDVALSCRATNVLGDYNTSLTFHLPKGTFTRSLKQVKLLDKALRHSHPLLLFPISLSKLSNQTNLQSILWHVNRFFAWTLTKKEVQSSTLLHDFITDPAFGYDRVWDLSIISEFKQAWQAVRGYFGSPVTKFQVQLRNTIPEAGLDELVGLVGSLHDRLAAIEGLLESLRHQLAWSRNVARAAEDVGRSISDVAQISFSGETIMTEDSKDFYAQLSADRDTIETAASCIADELEIYLVLQCKEAVKPLALLQFWVQHLTALDSAISARLFAEAESPDELNFQLLANRELLAKEVFMRTKGTCIAGVKWYLDQADAELALALDNASSTHKSSARERSSF